MNFYVYEDNSRHYVRVHTGHCKYCNEGKGVNVTRQPVKTWHGPYATLEEAQALALSLKKRSTRACGVCLPDSKPTYIW